MERLLDAEVFVNGDARGTSDSAGDVAHQSFDDTRPRAVVRNWHLVQRGKQFVAVLRALANIVVTDQILLDKHAKNRPEAESVGAGAHAQMEIRHLSGLGATRIDHNESAARIDGDVA